MKTVAHSFFCIVFTLNHIKLPFTHNNIISCHLNLDQRYNLSVSEYYLSDFISSLYFYIFQESLCFICTIEKPCNELRVCSRNIINHWCCRSVHKYSYMFIYLEDLIAKRMMNTHTKTYYLIILKNYHLRFLSVSLAQV